MGSDRVLADRIQQLANETLDLMQTLERYRKQDALFEQVWWALGRAAQEMAQGRLIIINRLARERTDTDQQV